MVVGFEHIFAEADFEHNFEVGTVEEVYSLFAQCSIVAGIQVDTFFFDCSQ